MSSNELRPVLIDGVSYPAILTDVKLEYDKEKGIVVLIFRYRIYINYSHVKEIEKNFYLYDVNLVYRNRTIEKLDKYLELYNLKLISKDYRVDLSLYNACKWLVGTTVEIKQRNYKGEKRYTLINTERKDFARINYLWNSMLNDWLDTYPEYRQNYMPIVNVFNP
ncbi:MAG: hypothetical protein OSJ63_04015 [Bacilli bacterium]|nr:hypothetical protein [Bacilli bacterium]